MKSRFKNSLYLIIIITFASGSFLPVFQKVSFFHRRLFSVIAASVAPVQSDATRVGLRSERQIVEGHSAAGGPVRSVLLKGIAGRRAERGEAAAPSRIVSSVQESRSGRGAEQRRLWFSIRWKAPFQLRLNYTYIHHTHTPEPGGERTHPM